MQDDEGDGAVDITGTDRVQSLLSQLDVSDFERVESPADVWDRITASVTSDRVLGPREPPWREFPASTVVEYRIDANDVVTEVGAGWAKFARDNDAPKLAVPASGRVLWTYFRSDEVQELWRLLVGRVRALQVGAEVPLRCDAPQARRWFDMTITPEPDAGVHFRCALAFEEDRPAVSLLDPHAERDDGLPPVALCGWCGRGQQGSSWVDIEELVRAEGLLERESMPPISNGICASCRDEMSAELVVSGGLDESTP